MKEEIVGQEIYKFDSGQPGPVVAVIGGTHGDELTGIRVVKTLLTLFRQGAIELMRGSLYLALGNPKAIEQGTRGSEATRDLNRCFRPTVLDDLNNTTYEVVRARDLDHALAGVNVAIDIHATKKPSKPFVVCQRKPQVADKLVYDCFAVDTVMTDTKWTFAGEVVSLEEHLARNGGVGLCYETGQARDTRRTSRVTQEMICVLRRLGMVSSGNASTPITVAKVVYDLEKAVMCPGLHLRWRRGAATRYFQPMSANTRQWFVKKSRVGEKPYPTTLPDDLVILFPKPESRWEMGKPIGYLARRLP